MAIQKADGVDAYNNFPSKFIKVYSTTALTAGQVVQIDFSAARDPLQSVDAFGFSVKLAVDESTPLACGVATETITAAGYVQVQYAGYNDQITSDAAIATLGTLVSVDANDGVVQAFTGNRTNAADYFGIVVKAFSVALNDGAIIILDKGFFNG